MRQRWSWIFDPMHFVSPVDAEDGVSWVTKDIIKVQAICYVMLLRNTFYFITYCFSIGHIICHIKLHLMHPIISSWQAAIGA